MLGATLSAVLIAGSASGSGNTKPGTITQGSAFSPALGENVSYEIYLPNGYDMSQARYPTLYLLHGRGDTMQAWTQEKADLDGLIASGAIPPTIVVMPDAPWSGRGSWYVDSQYTGSDYPGRPVETALTHDLVNAIDAAYRTVPDRAARAIGGYSMGGFGAIRYVLAHPDVFSAGLVLSPAVYTPLPPSDSSTRDYGAFGTGTTKFDDAVYQSLNYPALLPSVTPNLPVHFFIAVGDDEYVNPDPADAEHDLDFESAKFYNVVKRVPGVTAEFRELNGGHDWDVWQPGFVAGIQDLFHHLSATAPTKLTGTLFGTAGDDRAGGVAADASGTTTTGFAAAASFDGQPYAGGLDAVVVRRDAQGATQWVTEFGTSAVERLYGTVRGSQGETYVAGYTHGNLDGQHPSTTTDDAFVARLGPDGTIAWITQFGDPGAADRAYALAANPAGGVYVGGYTKGSLGGVTNAGDKDGWVAAMSAGGQLRWVSQLGGVGEDKTLAVTAVGGGVAAAGVAGAGMPGGTALGGRDGWVARFDDAGTEGWLREVGTADNDQLAGISATPDGDIVAVGDSVGSFSGSSAGGHDAIALRVTASGRTAWSTQLGTAADDRAADVAVQADGSSDVAVFTDGAFAAPAGDVDIAVLRLSDKGKELSAAQFGTARADGGDPFAEENMYLGSGNGLWLTGLTYGSLPGQPNQGSGDVFVTQLDPQTGAPTP
jgi:enterochelin esterase-like enzyme